jgi:uncharacterized protein YciI
VRVAYATPTEVARVRPQHRTYMMELIERGNVVAAGSFLPDDDGGLFLYEAADLDEVRRMVEDDPYVREGISCADHAAR